jgi:hypothetical protein
MIICAALKVQVEGLDHTTIIPCIRHGDGFQILEDLGYAPKTKYRVLQQGFMTHDNVFMTREEAFKYAYEIGQIPANIRHKFEPGEYRELFSEDLY